MDLSGWFVHTVTVKSTTGRAAGASADPTFGSARTVACRVEAARQRIRKADGTEAVSSHVIFSEDPIYLTDRIWLPGADTGSTAAARVPLAIPAPTDKFGTMTLYETHVG